MARTEFSPEQSTMVDLLRFAGHPDPEDVVRTNLTGAAYFGSHLRPLFEARVQAFLTEATALAEEIVATSGVDEKASRDG